MERVFPVPHEPYDGSAEEAPVAKMWYGLLADSLKRRHERLHVLPPGSAPVFSVRSFSNGAWQEVFAPPAMMYRTFIRRLKVMADLDLVRRVPVEEGRFRLQVGSLVFDIEVTLRIREDGAEEVMIELPPAPAAA